MKTQTASKKKELSLWQTVFEHRYCHRSWSLKINYDSAFSLLNRHYLKVNSWPSLWVKQASVWATNWDGPENIRGLASADSKSTESAIWPSGQRLPVLPSFPCHIPQSTELLGLQSTLPTHQLKSSHGGFLHFKEETFFHSVITFSNPKRDWCNTLCLNYGHNVTFNFDFNLV